MTIRNRLTLWYGGVSLISILLMAGVMYYELVIERRAAKANGRHKEPMEEEVAEIILFYGVPTALVATISGGWLLRKALAPLNDLTNAAERIHAYNLHEQLPRSRNRDEIDRLSEVLNAMALRLHESFKQVHEFTLHASHELKTPLAVLHGEIETALADPAISPAQREALASQLSEIQRLAKIVESLTLLAKADAGRVELSREQVRLDELLRDYY